MEKDEKAGFKPSNHRIYWVFRFVVIIPYGHTYASTLYDAGVDIKSAQIFLGHANIELTLEVYTHLSQFKKDEAISSLNAHLDKYASEMSTTDSASTRKSENPDSPQTQE